MAGFHTFSENFPGTTLNSSVWSQSGTAVTVSSNGVNISVPTGGSTTLNTNSSNQFSLRSSSIMFQVTSFARSGDSYSVFSLTSGVNLLAFEISGTSGSYQVSTYFGSVTPFAFTAGDWLRIRHSGTSYYIDSSSNGIAWTNRGSVSNSASGVPSPDELLSFEVYSYSLSSGTVSLTIKNINIAQTNARFLIANGTWNNENTIIWSYTSGNIGGAIPPDSDSAIYIVSNFTATLGANLSVSFLSHTNGTLALSSYILSIGQSFSSSGTTARTINMNSGTIETGVNSTWGDFGLSGSNLTFNCGTSNIILNIKGPNTPRAFATLSKTFYNVRINMGNGTNSMELDVTGSPTMSLLDVRSVGTTWQTVVFEDGSTITVNKFIGIGASSGSKLTFIESNGFGYANINVVNSGTTYGQYVAMNYISATGATPAYLGSNSSQAPGGNTSWTLQDPAKISTLIDPMTTAIASSSYWNKTGTVTDITTGYAGGGYYANNGSDDGANFITKSSYDLTDSAYTFQVLSPTFGNIGSTFGTIVYGLPGEHVGVMLDTNAGPIYSATSLFGSSSTTASSGSTLNDFYYKVALSGTTLSQYFSTDGVSFSLVRSDTVEPILFKSLRPATVVAGSRQLRIGVFNILPVGNLSSFFAFFYP